MCDRAESSIQVRFFYLFQKNTSQSLYNISDLVFTKSIMGGFLLIAIRMHACLESLKCEIDLRKSAFKNENSGDVR